MGPNVAVRREPSHVLGGRHQRVLLEQNRAERLVGDIHVI